MARNYKELQARMPPTDVADNRQRVSEELARLAELSRGTWPISRYAGTWPTGKWEFAREFSGTLDEARLLAKALENEHRDGSYRIWNCR